MADDSDTQDTPALPPKLNLRKQGILKKEPTATPETAPKQDTSRLVVKPAAAPAPKAEPEAETAAPAPAAGTDEAPAIKLKPLKPKPATPAPQASETPAEETPAAEAEAKPVVIKAPAPKEADPTKTDTKRKTARIPLDKAKPADDGSAEKPAGLKPKTIKIKPAAPLPRIRSTQPLSITAPVADGESGAAQADAEKRKTSRIPLEEALTADKVSDEAGEPSDPARPKTIKIKRPGSTEAATVKLKKPPAAGDGPALGETARLDNLPLDDADSTPTQKKTIRVKRPSSPGGGAPALAKANAAASTGLGLMPPQPFDDRSDEPGVIWALFGIAAMLVLCVVIYMLAAQAVGPNVSGTQLSSWKDGPALSWPGKILN